MKCSFCSLEFDEISAAKVCSKCSLFGGCQMIKCPRCGYETPLEPKWIRRLRRKKGAIA